MVDESTLKNIMTVGKRIIESENRHNFEVDAIDDSEHIPRMARIADAVQDFIIELGATSEQSGKNAKDLLDYARHLYVAEWMRPQAGDDSPPIEEDAIKSFNSYLNRE